MAYILYVIRCRGDIKMKDNNLIACKEVERQKIENGIKDKT